MGLEEAIKYLKIIKDTDLLKAGYPYGVEAIQTVLQALEEVTEERNDYRSQLNGIFDNGFIPKKKIEDKIKEIINKIEEYEKKKEETYNFMGFWGREILKLNQKLFALQELLEDK